MNLSQAIISSTLIVVFSCRPRGEPPVCAEYIELNSEDSADTRVLPFDTWYAILIPGTTRRPTLAFPESPRECSGQKIAVRLDNADSSSEQYQHTATQLPERELTEDDVTFSPGPDGKLLIWARINYYDDQTAIGPVALVQLVDRGVEVRGIGTLLAPYKRSQLHLESFADGESLLVASGEVCDDEGEACGKDVYLSPLIGQRFVQAGMVVDGDFIGPAKISTHERRDGPTDDNGELQREEVDRVFRIADADINLAETVTILKCDTQSTPPECHEHKNTQHRRTLTWSNGHFTTTSGVWEGMHRP